MTFEERIRSSYLFHTQLITALSTTSNASSRALATTHYINDLRARIESSKKNLETLRPRVHKLRSEYEVLRDGHAKRLIFKVSGKTEELEAKTSNAEHAYQDALEKQARAKKTLETLQSNLKDADRELLEAKDQAAIHKFTISELDALHNTLFSSWPLSNSPSSPFHPTSTPCRQILPPSRTPHPLERRAQSQIRAIKNGPLASLTQQILHETQVLNHLCEARKSLIWAHASILDAEDSARYNASAIYEYRSLGKILVRTTLSVAQCHAMRGCTAFEEARKLRAASDRNGRRGESTIQPLRELRILKELSLMAPWPSSPSSPSAATTFSPASLSPSRTESTQMELLPWRSPPTPTTPSLPLEVGDSSNNNSNSKNNNNNRNRNRNRNRSRSRNRSDSSESNSTTTSVCRLLDEKELAVRIAWCKAEMKPAIVHVRSEIEASERRVVALEEGQRALESQGRDILRRARIGVVESVVMGRLVVVGGGGGGGDAGDGDVEGEGEGEGDEIVQVYLGPPGYEP